MKAGLMRRTVRLQRPDVSVRDGFDGQAKTWVDVATVAASVDAISGRELFGSDRELADMTWRLVLREVPGQAVQPGWRAVDIDDGSVFDLRAVLPSHLRNQLTFAASSGSTQP